jgi:hypothetical protein
MAVEEWLLLFSNFLKERYFTPHRFPLLAGGKIVQVSTLFLGVSDG